MCCRVGRPSGTASGTTGSAGFPRTCSAIDRHSQRHASLRPPTHQMMRKSASWRTVKTGARLYGCTIVALERDQRGMDQTYIVLQKKTADVWYPLWQVCQIFFLSRGVKRPSVWV